MQFAKNTKARLAAFLILLILLAGSFGWLVFSHSYIFIHVPSGAFYEGRGFTASDVTASWHSPFGIKLSEEEIAGLSASSKGSSYYKLSINGQDYEVECRYVPLDYIKAEYKGNVKHGGEVDKSAFSVTAVYKDKKQFSVSVGDCELSDVPERLDGDASVKVSYLGQTCSVKLHPVGASSAEVTYAGGMHVGDVFDPDKLGVSVSYEDGTTQDITGFSCDFSGEIQADSKIVVKTDDYGELDGSLFKKDATGFAVNYDGKIYEGDSLKPDKLHVFVEFGDEQTCEIHDYEFVGKHIFEAESVQVTSQMYGEVSCKISPIPVAKVSGEVAGSSRGVSVKKIVFTYKDKTEKELDLDEVKFITDLSKDFDSGNQEIRFSWRGHEYSFGFVM